MKFTINSKKIRKLVEFSRPGSSYLFVDLNGQSGTLGKQICYGGSFMGDTLAYSGEDEDRFKRICKNWWRQYLQEEFKIYE